MTDRPRVVVVGGGFAGFHAARSLAKRLGGDAEIVVINSTDYFLYLPLLPEVATSLLDPRRVAVPLAASLPGVRVVLGEVDEIDLEARRVGWMDPEGDRRSLTYDRLLLTVGSVNKLLPVPGIAEHAHGFRDILVLKEGGKYDQHDYSYDYPQPYIPRRYTFEIDERIDAQGNVVRALDLEQARQVVRTLKERDQEIADVPIQPPALAGLIALIDKGTISTSVAKGVFATMYDSGRSADEIVREEGLAQNSDEGALSAIVTEVLGLNADAAAQYRSGKKQTFGFLVGQVMKKSGGKANPKLASDLVKRALES